MPKLVRLGTTDGVEIPRSGLTVGRVRGCDLVLRSKSVSRKHARIWIKNETVWIEDLNSSNGTEINGVAIHNRVTLKSGDKVNFGDHEFVVVVDTPPAPQPTKTKAVRRDRHGTDRTKSVRSNQKEAQPTKEFTNDPFVSSSPISRLLAQLSESEAVSAKRKDRKKFLEESAAFSNRFAQAEAERRRPYIRAAVIGLFVLSLLRGFVFGTIATALAAIELPGERVAKNHQNSWEPPQQDSPVAARPAKSAEPNARPQEFKRQQESSAPPLTIQNPNSRADLEQPQSQFDGDSDNSLPENVETIDSISLPEASTQPGSASPEELGDSVKTIRLVREIKREGIELSDEAAIRKLAAEKLNFTPEQTTRILKLLNRVADRNSLLDGRFRPENKPTTPPKAKTPVATPQSAPKKAVRKQLQNSIPLLDGLPLGNGSQASGPNILDPTGAQNNRETESTSSFTSTPPAATHDPAPPAHVRPRPNLALVNRGAGHYFNLWGLALILCLVLEWFYSVCWMGRDANSLGFSNPIWVQSSLATGPAGILFAFLCPGLSLGALVGYALISSPLLAYIAYRDECVPPQWRLLKFVEHFEPEQNILKSPEPNPVKREADPVMVELISSSEVRLEDGGQTPSEFEFMPGMKAAKSLIGNAIARHASNILFDCQGEFVIANLIIDGDSRPICSYPIENSYAIIKALKVLSTLSSSEIEDQQNGSFRVRIVGEEFRISTELHSSAESERLNIELLRYQEDLFNLAGLGCDRKVQGKLRGIVAEPTGLFLVCGPPDSGKSTTLRSIVSEFDASIARIVTIEAPVEYPIEGATQIDISLNAKKSIARALRNALTQGPDVVMVGEIFDFETALLACQAANEGQLVLSSVDESESVGAIYRLIDMGLSPDSIANALSGVLEQRLVRRLCEKCKIRYRPGSELLRRLRIPVPPETAFCRPSLESLHCLACEGEGYRGRIGIFELLTIDDRIRSLIRERAASSKIISVARRSGMTTLRESALRHVIKGRTTLDEVRRVIFDSET